jgi:hypothetical protein
MILYSLVLLRLFLSLTYDYSNRTPLVSYLYEGVAAKLHMGRFPWPRE